MSSTLPEFISRLCGKFAVATPGDNLEEKEFVISTLSGLGKYKPEEILQVLQDYPQLCITQLQIWNLKRKESEKLLINANK